jgi:hypothetical protein
MEMENGWRDKGPGSVEKSLKIFLKYNVLK